MTARELLPAAAATVTDLVSRIPEAAWAHPSPCAGWTVRDVLNHLTSEHLWAPRLLAGETLTDVGDAYSGDVLGDGPVTSWQAAITGSLAAWAVNADDERIHQMTHGPLRQGEYAQQMLVDLVVHAWDMAQGAGLTVAPPDEAVAESFRYEQPRAGAIEGIFAAPVPTDSQDPLQQLVALTGRRPLSPR